MSCIIPLDFDIVWARETMSMGDYVRVLSKEMEGRLVDVLRSYVIMD